MDFDREITRKEFIVYLAVFFASLTGISSLIQRIPEAKILASKKVSGKDAASEITQGFGSGLYGGSSAAKASQKGA